jgi:hypothetical protein
MAGTTTNNGWDYPTSTDYVKDGATAIETLATDIDTSTGKGLIAWQTWAPTLSAGWLNGNGTWDAKYCQIGKTVHIRANFTVGSTTTKGTDMRISLPVTAAVTSQTWNCNSSVAGGTQYSLLIRMETTTALRVLAQNAAGTYTTITQMTAAVPGTWATGDIIAFQITYEAA